MSHKNDDRPRRRREREVSPPGWSGGAVLGITLAAAGVLAAAWGGLALLVYTNKTKEDAAAARRAAADEVLRRERERFQEANVQRQEEDRLANLERAQAAREQERQNRLERERIAKEIAAERRKGQPVRPALPREKEREKGGGKLNPAAADGRRIAEDLSSPPGDAVMPVPVAEKSPAAVTAVGAVMGRHRAFHKVTEACWGAKDAGLFYVLTADKKVEARRAADGALVRSLALPEECHYLRLTSAGLYVQPEQGGIGYVLDAGTLDVRRRVRLLRAGRPVASAGHHEVYYVSAMVGDDFAKPGRLFRVDLLTRKTTLVGSGDLFPAFGRSRQQFAAALSPDGKSLFFFDNGGISRARAEGDGFVKEQTTRYNWSSNNGGYHVFLSPDGKKVCSPAGAGNGGDRPYINLIFDAADLTAEPTFVRSGAYPRVVGFDPANGRIFAQAHGDPLLVYDEAGTKTDAPTFPSAPHADDVRAIDADPSGSGMVLLRIDKTLLLVALGKKK